MQIMEINSGWQFRQAGSTVWNTAIVPGCVHTDLLNNNLIDDPFYRVNERSLQWIDKVNWEYQVMFDVQADLYSKKNIFIFFKGLDTFATIFINGIKVASTNNMFREWRTDCREFIKEYNNILSVYFSSPIFKGLQALEDNGYPLPAPGDQSLTGGLGDNRVSPFTRKAMFHHGWDWGPRFVTSGIWRKVFIEGWNDARIESTYIIQKKVTAKLASLSANMEIESDPDQKITVVVAVNDKEVVRKNVFICAGLNNIEIDFEINSPRFWWINGLGEAYLYNITIHIIIENKIINQVSINTGIRKLSIVQEPDPNGEGKSFYVLINNTPVFAKGTNYIPNDSFPRPTVLENYEKIIKSAVDAHMNMIRVWGGGIYENDEFYDLCDRNGILIWQDFMFACAMYPGNEEFLINVELEAVENVKRLRNHPCIALWCGNNEMEWAWAPGNEMAGWGWKQQYTTEIRDVIWKNYKKIFHKILPDVLKVYTDNSFYWPSSPTAGDGEISTDKSRSGDIHYWGVWHGKHPLNYFNKFIGRFMSEYGFQSFPEFKTVKEYALPTDFDIESEVMMSHQRSEIGNLRIREYMEDMYKKPKDFEMFLYASQLLQAEAIKIAIEAHRRNMPYTMGSLYWQINDCWPVASWSSIDYFGRWKALHYFVKKAFRETMIMIHHDDHDVLKIFAVTDHLKGINASIELTIFNFEGKILWNKIIISKIIRNTGILIYETHLDEILKDLEKRSVFLFAEIKENKKILAENIYYFVPPKELWLERTMIKKKIEKTLDGFSIKLLSDKLTKNVYLNFEKTEVFFTDNYFDLLPGREIIIDVKSASELFDVESQLKVISLIDSY